MKKNILFLLGALLFTFAASAQNDTMYVMKNGAVAAKFNVNTEVDSVIFYQPNSQQENTFVDERDGTVYHYVTIGNQVWMAENLKYLPTVTDTSIITSSEPCYYVYRYGGSSVEEAKQHPNYINYGVLYNWNAAMNGAPSSGSNPSGVQGACPEGWHLPSYDEWTQLTDYLGGEGVSGGKLKDTGTTFWNSPNVAATNEVGFTARGGGLHASLVGKFLDLKDYGYWWTTNADPYYPTTSYVRFMRHDQQHITPQNYNNDYGFSVRCVRD